MGMILPSWGVAFTPPCLWLVYQARGSYPTLVLPGHSTALTPADGGCMDFPSVAVPWSPCFSPFAWRGLQPLVGPPAQHPRAESPLERHSFQHFYLGQPGNVALIRYPMRLNFGNCVHVYPLHAQPGYVALVGYPNAAELVCIRCDTSPPPLPSSAGVDLVYSPLLVACIPGSWLIFPLALPGHSTALTPADGGFMDFPSVAVPWSPCFSSFARPGLQYLVGPPAPTLGIRTLLSTTSSCLLSVYLPISAWIRGIG